jgi:hypothetical protein
MLANFIDAASFSMTGIPLVQGTTIRMIERVEDKVVINFAGMKRILRSDRPEISAKPSDKNDKNIKERE